MRIIDILQKVANGEIKEGTKIILNDDLFIFNGGVFGSGLYYLENCIFLKKEDLNQEVELIPPKPKKYSIKFDMRWFDEDTNYLNYDVRKNLIFLSGDEHYDTEFMTQFTKQELQSIQPVREFLEDMKGKYELVEVKG